MSKLSKKTQAMMNEANAIGIAETNAVDDNKKAMIKHGRQDAAAAYIMAAHAYDEARKTKLILIAAIIGLVIYALV